MVCYSSHSASLATNNLLKTQQCLKGFMLNNMMTTIKTMVILGGAWLLCMCKALRSLYTFIPVSTNSLLHYLVSIQTCLTICVVIVLPSGYRKYFILVIPIIRIIGVCIFLHIIRRKLTVLQTYGLFFLV